jgi:hypothetical protein
MRIVFVYVTLLILVLVSLGAGFFASDWPRWCSRAHWCAPGWPHHQQPGSSAGPTTRAKSRMNHFIAPLALRF